jgi:hypothetical protein
VPALNAEGTCGIGMRSQLPFFMLQPAPSPARSAAVAAPAPYLGRRPRHRGNAATSHSKGTAETEDLAVIKFLRHSGIQIEELIELPHHSLDQYRLPATGKLTPRLQLARSKTGTGQEAAWTSH